MSKTFEVYYSVGALCGWFLITASNFRRARADAIEYLGECGILPVEVLRVRLKTWGLQLEPEHANRLIDPWNPQRATPGFERMSLTEARWSLGTFLALHEGRQATTEER